MNNIKIVKLYADWCAPCKILHKMMSDNNIEFENIDVATEKGINCLLDIISKIFLLY